mmetsp:Transcript_14706/g.34670  ORF Transcript_14706/g.34670 Transcript_14706/m.34670 type:complete len:271 (+) Transcript_14706:162-974(+)
MKRVAKAKTKKRGLRSAGTWGSPSYPLTSLDPPVTPSVLKKNREVLASRVLLFGFCGLGMRSRPLWHLPRRGSEDLGLQRLLVRLLVAPDHSRREGGAVLVRRLLGQVPGRDAGRPASRHVSQGVHARRGGGRHALRHAGVRRREPLGRGVDTRLGHSLHHCLGHRLGHCLKIGAAHCLEAALGHRLSHCLGHRLAISLVHRLEVALVHRQVQRLVAALGHRLGMRLGLAQSTSCLARTGFSPKFRKKNSARGRCQSASELVQSKSMFAR